jgi:hypothetical protein
LEGMENKLAYWGLRGGEEKCYLAQGLDKSGCRAVTPHHRLWVCGEDFHRMMIPWKRRRNKTGRRAERGSNKEQAIRFNEVAPLFRIDLRSLRFMDETNPLF